MPRNKLTTKRKDKFKHELNVNTQPITRETALKIKLVDADIKKLAASISVPLTNLLSLASRFPFVLSYLIFNTESPLGTLILNQCKSIGELHYQYDMHILAEVLAKKFAAYPWQAMIEQQFDLTSATSEERYLATEIEKRIQDSGEHALIMTNVWYVGAQRVLSVLLTILLKKYTFDPFVARHFPYHWFQSNQQFYHYHIHTEALGMEVLRQRNQLKKNMEDKLKIGRILSRGLLLVLLLNLFSRDGLELPHILMFLGEPFSIALYVFALSNLTTDLADLYHYARDPYVLRNARQSLQKITANLSLEQWHEEYRGTLAASYLYLDIKEFKRLSVEDFSTISLSKVRNALLGVFLKHKISIIFSSSDFIYVAPNFNLSPNTMRAIADELKQVFQFLVHTALNKPALIKQLETVARWCELNIEVAAQPFSNIDHASNARDYQFVIRILRKNDESIENYYNCLIDLYGVERVCSYETDNQSACITVTGCLPTGESDFREALVALKAKSRLASSVSVVAQAAVPLQQQDSIVVDTIAAAGITPKRNPQYQKPKQEKPKRQKPSANTSQQALVIKWRSGVCFDETQPNNGADGVIELKEPYWPGKSHFAFFRSTPDEFPTKMEYDAFKAAVTRNSIVPTDTWVQKDDGTWFEARRKAKLPTKDARLYESDVDVVKVDGQWRILHTFGIYMQHTHK